MELPVGLTTARLFTAAGAVVSGELTIKLIFVVLVMLPLVAETVIGYVPVGVDNAVEIVNVVEHAGLHEVGLKELAAPEGSPDIENVTA